MATIFDVQLLAIFAVFVTLPMVCIGSTQTITFFAGYGCPATGQNGTFTDTNDQLKGTWIETGANSVFILGLWKIFVDSSTMIFYNTLPPDGRCVNKTDWTGSPEGIERLGPSDMTSSQIIFFTERFYNGLSYKVDTEEIGQFPDNPSPLAIQPYIQFGRDSWKTYPEINFMGNSSHFEASKTAVDQSDSYTFNDSVLLIVGSVRKDLKVDSGASILSVEIIACCCIAILNVLTSM